MDNTQTPDVSSGKQHLGKRAFSLIVSKHARVALVILLISIVVLIFRNFFGNNSIMDQVVLWSFVLFIIFLVEAFLVGWLIYANYTFALEDDAFRISRGVLSKKETAIPYRQIRDVNIERSLYQRMYGVSKLIILTVGEESLSASVSEAVLPIVDNIDKNLALKFQNELLRRANVQKVSQQ
jgi:uncharacterized membrane protein YdbT with pleckstrin-like domain